MGSIITRTSCPCCANTSIRKVLTCNDYTVSDESFDIMECGNCTIRFTQDVPDQKSIVPYYNSETYISHTDTEKGFVNRLYKLARNYTLRWKIKLVKERLRNMKSIALLDIGAGTGAFLHEAVLAGWSVTGLEPDSGARKICRDKYGIQMEEPEDLFLLPAENYDVVTLWHVLEHVHQLQEYMYEIKRVLRPGGAAFIALPNYTSGDAQVYQQYWAAYDVPRHLYHFSPKAVDTLAKQHGLKMDSIKPMWLDAFYIALLSERYKRGGAGNMASAAWNGLRSNLHALKNKLECSSLVYIIRHNEHVT